MALDNSELGPDEVDLQAENTKIWAKARIYWDKFLNDWENELYYPIFAPRGISKGHALTSYCVKIELIDIYNLILAIRQEATKEDDDDEGDAWKPLKG